MYREIYVPVDNSDYSNQACVIGVDVARQFGKDATRSGFQLNAQLPAEAAEGDEADVRVFGIFAGEAVELQR